MRNISIKKIILISLILSLTTISSAAALSVKSNKKISTDNFFITIFDLIMELLEGGIF